MTHPPNMNLESYAAGDGDAIVREHLLACEDCAKYVSELESQSNEFQKSEADELVAKMMPAPVAAPAPTEKKTNVTFVQFARRISPILAVAAAFLLLARWNDWIAPSSPAQISSVSGISSGSDERPRFKGGMQVAVVRERGRKQDRLVSDVAVAPNDRVRVEVSVDRDQPVTAGILEDDGTWTMLIAPALLSSGTHFSEKAARFDARPTNGLVLVGAPDAVTKARETKNYDGVIAMPIHPERAGTP